jgi:hypothetical protein
MWTTWWFGINDENSDLCGEEFFVEVNVTLDIAKREAIKMAKEIFPNEKISCYGRVSTLEAEMMGLDTY